jgi:DNA-binding beta-propeller fold protein YncE
MSAFCWEIIFVWVFQTDKKTERAFGNVLAALSGTAYSGNVAVNSSRNCVYVLAKDTDGTALIDIYLLETKSL